MRRYRNHLVDSARWERFPARPDDVVISTPSKCGTTWMQQLVGMVLLDRIEFDRPLGTISPWLDMLTVTDEQIFDILEAQTHRRFIKTHAPLDGVPRHDSWTYITVFRHPLDAALSWRDHFLNLDRERARELVTRATGEAPAPRRGAAAPEDPTEFLHYWIGNDLDSDGSSLHGLQDYANSLTTSWELRDRPNVHLFHYDDLWNDLDGQVRRLEELLGVSVDPSRHREIVEAGALDAMRTRSATTSPTTPTGDGGIFKGPSQFFRQGGRRDWPSMLNPDEVSDARRRLEDLVGAEAAEWAMRADPST